MKNYAQSETTAKLLDSEMWDAFLNSVNPYFISERKGRVTAVVTKARYQKQPKIKFNRDTNTLPDAVVTRSSRSYCVVDLMVT